MLWFLYCFLALISCVHADIAHSPTVRIKDIARFPDARPNYLVGYGLVVGLKGSGDSLRDSPFTKESIISMLERMGINTRNINIGTKNIAAVMVTCQLPPFARQGTNVDITVSTMGNSTSLLVGTLLPTPLLGADGEAYAVGQGQVNSDGFTVSGANASVTKGVPTNGRIPNGAIVEREIDFSMKGQSSLRLTLNNPDWTTAKRICNVINEHFKKPIAVPQDMSTIDIKVDPSKPIVSMITEIEQLPVTPDQPARVIIDSANNIIIITAAVRISKVAVASGALTVRITETPIVSQPQIYGATGGININTSSNPAVTSTSSAIGNVVSPNGNATPNMNTETTSDGNTNTGAANQPPAPLALTGTDSFVVANGAQTVYTTQTNIDVDDGQGQKMGLIEAHANLNDLVAALNALKASPADIINILLAIKRAGAIHAIIESI